MIKLAKGPEPAVLVKNREVWRKVLKDKRNAGIEPTKTELSRYNHPEIKDSLLQETSKKCAYCESFFRHVTHGDVEHIVPKKKEEELRFVWENLTIACDVCNTKKADEDYIADPYEVDPSAIFAFAGATVVPRFGSDIAFATAKRLDLNRAALLEMRQATIDRLNALAVIITKADNENLRKVLIEDLCGNETLPSCQFAAVARAHVIFILDELASTDRLKKAAADSL